MRALIITFGIIAAWALSPGALGEGEEKLIPEKWAPSLAGVANALKAETEKKDGGAPGQQQLNDISARLADVYDAQLFVAYGQLLNRLKTEGREQLCREQEQWLSERKSKAAAAVQSEGGSLASLEYSSAFADLTQKRIAELQARLQQQIEPSKREVK